MNKITVNLAIFASLFFCLFIGANDGSKIQAQVQTEAIPEQKADDHLTAEDKLLLRDANSLADDVDEAMSSSESKWKLTQKNSQLYSANESPQKGGANFKATDATLKWKKGKAKIFVSINTKKTSTKEQLSEQLKLSITMIARGIVEELPDVGEEGYFITDFPTTPSTSISLDFRRGLRLVHISYDNQSKSREVNIIEAKKIAKIIDSGIKNLNIITVN